MHLSSPRSATRRGYRWLRSSPWGGAVRYPVGRGLQADPAGHHQASRVLEGAGIVRGVRAGREMLFEFDPQPMEAIQTYLDLVFRAVGSGHWPG